VPMPPSRFIIEPEEKNRLCYRPATPVETTDATEVSSRARRIRLASVALSRLRQLLGK
jgi:hypothetical protein